jgi:hypothetical protein
LRAHRPHAGHTLSFTDAPSYEMSALAAVGSHRLLFAQRLVSGRVIT